MAKEKEKKKRKPAAGARGHAGGDPPGVQNGGARGLRDVWHAALRVLSLPDERVGHDGAAGPVANAPVPRLPAQAAARDLGHVQESRYCRPIGPCCGCCI